MNAEDIRLNVRLIFGDTEDAWAMHTAPPTEDEGGATVIRYPEGTDPTAVIEIHNIIQSALEGIMGE